MLSLRLAIMFRIAYPETYERYRGAFDEGNWVKVDDTGPFLGRAIVYKLQVLPHRDGGDGGPAVIFPLGDFEGGELYLPDVGAKLR